MTAQPANDEFEGLLVSASPLDQPIAITWFNGDRDLGKEERRGSLRELAAQIKSEHATTKAGLRAIKLARFGDYREHRALRNNANVLAVAGVEVDHDSGTITFEEAERRVTAAGLAGLLVTTASHSATAHHWRGFFPLSAEVAPGARASLVERLNGLFDGELDQHASFTLSQLQYVGSVDGGLPNEARLIDGRPLDVATDLDTNALPKGGRPGAAAPVGEEELLTAIRAGESYHPAFVQLAGKWSKRGDTEESCVDRLRAAMEAVPSGKRDRRWRDRLKQMPRDVRDIFKAEQRRSDNEFDDEFDELDESEPAMAYPTGHAAPSLTSTDDDLESLSVHPVTRRLNKRHAVVVVRGRILVTTESTCGRVDFGDVRGLHTYYANDLVAKPGDDEKRVAASQRWLSDPDRRQYPNGVTFAPDGCEPGTLNLWRGWAVEPNPNASCDLFIAHLRTIVCRGDEAQLRYILGWLAHMVQRPGQKAGVALVLRGPKGAGKDTVADYLAAMIGRRHAPTVADSRHIIGNFNARLEAALLLHVQEGSWAGDRKAEEVLKYLVTSDHIEIERKGIDSINLPSVLRIFISANAEWVVPASVDERRWAVFEVSGARRGDEVYFEALRHEMGAGGPGALLYYLTNYDLSGFNVRKAPETEGLRNQKLASLRNIASWWMDALSSAEAPSTLGSEWEESISVGRDALRSAYTEWMKSRRFDGEVLDMRQFGLRLREMLPSLSDKRSRDSNGRRRQYVLPPVSECRAAFEVWLGAAVQWEDL